MRRTDILKIFLILTLILFFCNLSYGFDLANRVIKTKLSNGLTVLMMERHLSPTVSFYISHHVGSVDEEKGESGAAHLLEHMMFKGTKTIGAKNYDAEKKIIAEIEKTGNLLDGEKRKGKKADPAVIKKLSGKLKKLQDDEKKLFIPNEIDLLYTQNGGLDMNASTGQDLTIYHVSLPSNKMELWARIEADRLLNPVFREFYTERDVVMEERRQRVESDPDGKLYETFANAAFKVHPYGRPVLGWTDDLMNLSPDSVRKIWKKYKAPSSMVIAVVGDIKPDKTLKLIKKYFGRIPAAEEIKTVIPAEPQQKEEKIVNVVFDANPMMLIGFHKPNAPAHDDYVFDVLDAVLSKGRTSRLYSRLVTDLQIATSISTANGIPGMRYPNLFVISAKPRYPHTNEELEKTILDEIEKIRTQPVTEEELSKAKNNLKMDFIKILDSNAEIASTLSYYEVLLGDYKYFTQYLENIDKVAASDIQKAAVRYLTKDNRTVAFLNKTGK